MMEAVRHALMIGRLRYGASAITHLDVLRWGTEGSARCLGRDDIGRIEVGRQADLALFTLDELRPTGVAMALYPLSAFRAMNRAALKVYEAIRRDGTQRAVVDIMQTREELYGVISYHTFEAKLDQLFAQRKD